MNEPPIACACGYRGPGEALLDALACPECGALQAAVDRSDVFDRTRFHYGWRSVGVFGPVLHALRPGYLRDAGNRPIALVRPAPSVRRVVVGLLALVFFVACVLGFLELLPVLPGGPLRWIVSLAVGWLLPTPVFALAALLAPAPDLSVLAAGGDPALLLRIRPIRERWRESELAVEDGAGASIGVLLVHRLRNAVPWTRAPLVELRTPYGTRFEARRHFPFAAGVVIRSEGDEAPVATYACNRGLFGRDAVETADPTPLDRRLILAAVLVVNP